MDLGDGVWGSGRPVRRRRPWSLRLLVGLQGRGGAAGERNMGANGNDLAILAAWGRAGGRAGGRRQTCMRLSVLGRRLFLFDSTVAVSGCHIKVADACRGLLVYFFYFKM
jgi:hypothetical protein